MFVNSSQYASHYVNAAALQKHGRCTFKGSECISSDSLIYFLTIYKMGALFPNCGVMCH